MLPERGFWGIEKGIQGDLVLKAKKTRKNPSFNINVSYDFPAAGNDHCRAVSSEAKYANCSIHDNGKYGKDNQHNLILTIAVNPQYSNPTHTNVDDTGIAIADIATSAATAIIEGGIAAATGGATAGIATSAGSAGISGTTAAKELLKAVVRGNGCAEEEEEAEEPECDDSASIQDKMKAGVTLENVYIMSEISGHVLTVPGGEEDGAVVQDEWLEEECQLWNISYDPSTKLALIASVLNPDCVLTVDEGVRKPGNLFLKAYEEDQVSQQWRYKMNYLFNQGKVLDVPYSSKDDGVHIGTYRRHGGDNQKWHIMQHE